MFGVLGVFFEGGGNKLVPFKLDEVLDIFEGVQPKLI